LAWPDELGSIRVTAGTREHNDAFLAVLEDFLHREAISWIPGAKPLEQTTPALP